VLQAYVLIQTEVGKAVAAVQAVAGVTRTLTCPVVRL
jgi:hypothetical protein